MNGAEQPMTFDAANRWLAGRVSVPTKMSSKEIALSENFRGKVRAHCFFSAKVDSANVLDGLRKEADKFARGETDLATARMNMKLFLVKHGRRPDDVADAPSPPPGVDPETWKTAKSLTNLASTARLNLILRQNARMAQAAGQYEVSMHPDVRERWPFIRYVPSTSSNPRDDHKKFYNLVLPKDHPFWRTHLPPSDFGCQCSWEDVDEEEAKEFGGVDQAIVTENPDGSQSARLDINGKPVNAEPPKSGFLFDIQEAFSAVDAARAKAPYRKKIIAALRQFVAAEKINRFTVFGSPAETSEKLIRPDNYAEVKKYFGEVGKITGENMGASKNELMTRLPDRALEMGVIPSPLRDALGLGKDESRVVISGGNRKWGLKHWIENHSQEMADSKLSLKILDESLFNLSARSVMTLNTSKKGEEILHVGFDNPETGSFCFLRQIKVPTRGKEPEKYFELVSVMQADEDFRKRQWPLKFMGEKE